MTKKEKQLLEILNEQFEKGADNEIVVEEFEDEYYTVDVYVGEYHSVIFEYISFLDWDSFIDKFEKLCELFTFDYTLEFTKNWEEELNLLIK